MVKLVIKPSELHMNFWEKIDSSIYAQYVTVPPLDREKITMQLLHIALESIMLSAPITDNGCYDDYLGPYVNQKDLHHKLMEMGLVESPLNIKSTNARKVASAVSSFTVGFDERTKMAYESQRHLAELAFGGEYSAFIRDIESTIVNTFIMQGKEFNPYLLYKVKAHTEHNGKIFGFEVEFGDDVRHQFYRKAFPGGRYDPVRADAICNVPDLSGDSES